MPEHKARFNQHLSEDACGNHNFVVNYGIRTT